MEEIYVIGGNHHNTLGVIRSLGYKRVHSVLVLVGDYDNPYIIHSKYIKQLYQVRCEEDAIGLLMENKKHHKHAVIIACSDGMASALDLHRDDLIDIYSIPGVGKQGELTKLMDKDVMSGVGKSMGLTIPPSWVIENVDDIKDVEYPCITKPILSIKGHKSDIRVCKDKTELLNLLLNGSCQRYQVQKFIEKDFEYQLIGLSIDGGKYISIPGYSRCIRPCPGTNTGFLHYESLERIVAPIEQCKSFIRKLGYSGLFSMEFLRDQNGVDYFMEINFRNDGNSICVTASGTNLPYIWYLSCCNEDYMKELTLSKFKPVYVMPELDDFKKFVRTGRISKRLWIKDILRTDKFMEFDVTDMKPFFVELSNYIRRFLKRIC